MLNDMSKNEYLKPKFFIEKGRSDVYLTIEYLVNITKNEEIELAKKIDSLNISRISIVTYNSKNENINYTPTLFKHLNKDKIKALYIDTKIDYDILNTFNRLEEIGIHLTNNKKLLLDRLDNLKSVTITGYNNNIDFNQLDDRIKFLSFWRLKDKTFSYSMHLKYVETLVITQYKSINLNKIITEHLKKLSIYGANEIIIDQNHSLLSTIEHLDLDHCNMSLFSSDVLGKMINLRELWLEKCDLSNLNEEVFKKLKNLKIMVLTDCKNLQTVNGLGNLDRVVLYSTKVLDNDTSPLLHSKDVFITNCKTYNLKNKDLPKK